MIVIPIVISAISTVTKGLVKGLEQLEKGAKLATNQTTELLRSTRIPRRVLVT